MKKFFSSDQMPYGMVFILFISCIGLAVFAAPGFNNYNGMLTEDVSFATTEDVRHHSMVTEDIHGNPMVTEDLTFIRPYVKSYASQKNTIFDPLAPTEITPKSTDLMILTLNTPEIVVRNTDQTSDDPFAYLVDQEKNKSLTNTDQPIKPRIVISKAAVETSDDDPFETQPVVIAAKADNNMSLKAVVQVKNLTVVEGRLKKPESQDAKVIDRYIDTLCDKIGTITNPDPDAVEKMMTELTELTEKDGSIYYFTRGYIHDLFSRRSQIFRYSNYSQAVKYYNKAIELNENVGIYRHYMGQVNYWYALFESAPEFYEKANVEYKIAERLAPEWAKPVDLQGGILFQQKKYHDAIPYFERALEIDETCCDAYNGLIDCYHQLTLSATDKDEFALKGLAVEARLSMLIREGKGDRDASFHSNRSLYFLSFVKNKSDIPLECVWKCFVLSDLVQSADRCFEAHDYQLAMVFYTAAFECPEMKAIDVNDSNLLKTEVTRKLVKCCVESVDCTNIERMEKYCDIRSLISRQLKQIENDKEKHQIFEIAGLIDQLVKIDSEHYTLYKNVAETYQLLGEYDNAIEEYKKYLGFAPYDEETFCALLGNCESNADWNQAFDVAVRLVGMRPGNADYWIEYAYTARHDGAGCEICIHALTQAINILEEKGDVPATLLRVYGLRALSYDAMNNQAKEMADLKQAIIIAEEYHINPVFEGWEDGRMMNVRDLLTPPKPVSDAFDF